MTGSVESASQSERSPQRRPRIPLRPKRLWFGPGVMLVSFLFVLGLIVWLTHQNSYAVKRNELGVQTESMGESLRLRLEGHTGYLLLLAAERSSGNLSAELFQERASHYVKSHPEMINITWVDADFVIRDVAPRAQNKQIVGLKLNLPEPKRISRLAMQTRQPSFTRPFEAIQGKPSFEVWVPVYRGDNFLGLFGGVYSCESVVREVASQLQPRLYHVSLVDVSGRDLAKLPLTDPLDKTLVHTVLITSKDSGIYLRSSAYRSGQDWRLSVLELLSLALVFSMAYALWQLKREIEERKRAEEALTASEEKLRLLLDSTGEAIYGMDLQGLCSFCNTACLKMLGYSHPSDLLGKDMHLQIHHSNSDGSQLPLEQCRIHQSFRQGESVHADDEVFWRSDGSFFAAEYWSYPQLKQGEVIGAVVTFINITERKQLEEQFRQSQKMESIGRLAGGVAHDFNNMLSVILGAAELSKCIVSENDPVRQYLELICKAANRSSDITRQLLAFSRKEVISPKPINLNLQILESQKMLVRLISEDIKLSFRPAANLWTVMIDPSQVDQILMNLSVNAGDAMPEGGSLTMETANIRLNGDDTHINAKAGPGDYIQLTVSDTGLGMDRETRMHIFEPFFTTKGVGQGTGLGLATVYGIVTQNNGFINVYSEPRKGSVFKLYLPRLRQEPVAEDKPAPVAAVSATILLVEDEEMLLLMATRLLEELGYTVIQAESPQDAIAICQENQSIDLILTDVVMPGMNGREMVERIKAIRPDVKVLFMSGYTADIVAQRGIVDEGMHYIQKPLEMCKLNEKIRQVLTKG